jgi:hypothetical protein
MFGLFRKKTPKPTMPSVLYFKSGQAFFEYQCEYGYTDIVVNSAIIGLVLDAERELGAPTPISIAPDGSQLAPLRIASPDGGFLVFANTPTAKGEKLQPGDVVLWVPSIYVKEAGEKMEDSRSGWVGLIRAKVRPEIDSRSPSFAIACRYD